MVTPLKVHTTFYVACAYLSIVGSMFIHVYKRGRNYDNTSPEIKRQYVFCTMKSAILALHMEQYNKWRTYRNLRWSDVA